MDEIFTSCMMAVDLDHVAYDEEFVVVAAVAEQMQGHLTRRMKINL